MGGIIPTEPFMRLPVHSRKTANFLAATLFTVVITVLLVWVHANEVIAGMVFLVFVVWSGTQAGMAPSLYIAVLCTLAFDYFFLPPYRTFVLAGAQEWVAMFSFVASSLAAGRVAERARRQTEQAERRREDVERLYTLSQEMALHEDAAGLTRDLPQLIQRIFNLDEVALYILEQDEINATTGEVPGTLKSDLRESAEGHTTEAASPHGYAVQTLLLGLRPVGALAWKPLHLSPEVATAIGAQVAIGLARAIAIETTAHVEAARESERLRTALIDSLTHELRTPLTSIRAAATTLVQGDGLDEATRKDLAAVVDEESFRLDALIGQAVEMAEIDAHIVQVRPELLNPRAFLERVVEEAQPILSRHEVVIKEASDETVRFDPRLLGRVFRHLLENAARYSPPGSRITLRCHAEAGRLEFQVEDNGPGIDKSDLPLIFEKFYRGKKGAQTGAGAGSRTRTGTGMGLAIARAILIAHRGSIEASSGPGPGATFRFWISLND